MCRNQASRILIEIAHHPSAFQHSLANSFCGIGFNMTSTLVSHANSNDSSAWVLEQNGLPVLRVWNPRQVDMFWSAFEHERIGDTFANLDPTFWDDVAPPVYRWRHENSGFIALNAFVAATPYLCKGSAGNYFSDCEISGCRPVFLCV